MAIMYKTLKQSMEFKPLVIRVFLKGNHRNRTVENARQLCTSKKLLSWKWLSPQYMRKKGMKKWKRKTLKSY